MSGSHVGCEKIMSLVYKQEQCVRLTHIMCGKVSGCKGVRMVCGIEERMCQAGSWCQGQMAPRRGLTDVGQNVSAWHT